ncbi:hypothetical protein NEUTE1DRAFT_117927 [Neurospora tetrasperma FGSC 2508]|uniref:Uncharacterized protein n=1 Tax=Neurospora tetrasperma (strain FGSC 2508 / ATCC MYA-4615 / P0657) TaxID=510951 RepID=F8MS30_NEUT8|nr:uncharacterized protein NEUTE1DRAFT_117927 [Neurospora tetrasperma FGSC 2508]EGO55824.1 hypothetical protein NEUTE1DRAFT_117927 [Neurospora tetrasperma FGSC 2508]EGZ68919.1 hypothetical protein NEUTE2DRAFT_145364 [Neurospora tetrasperma FGSC 2509]
MDDGRSWSMTQRCLWWVVQRFKNPILGNLSSPACDNPDQPKLKANNHGSIRPGSLDSICSHHCALQSWSHPAAPIYLPSLNYRSPACNHRTDGYR